MNEILDEWKFVITYTRYSIISGRTHRLLIISFISARTKSLAKDIKYNCSMSTLLHICTCAYVKKGSQ